MKNIHKTGKELYITNDEEVKEGDWYINTFVIEREQKPQTHTEKRHLLNHQKDYRFKYCKKIILTTDQDLIDVQDIDDEFLEWFVKNPSCEEVEVERDSREVGGHNGGVQIEYGYYEIIIPKEEPKQETLEEVAERYANMQEDVSETIGKYLVKAVFKDGAKWQQERSYSEEDLKYAYEQGKLYSNICYSRTFENVLEIIKIKKK